MTGRIAYTPLDTLLERPAVRILRAARWFGWVEVDELLLAAGAPECWEDRQHYAKALSRLVASRHVERRVIVAYWSRRPRRLTHYRITAAGRRDLARRLRVDMQVDGTRSAA